MEVFHVQGKIDRAPSIETCIHWEMKLGLYKLTRQKQAADDWIWIPDHVVNKGAHKCLLVLGVRMSTLLEKGGDLTLCHEDMEPLGLVPMRKSNGGLIEIECENILKACNGIPPLAIVKDHGPDLHCGTRKFCEVHTNTIEIYDVTHKIARLYEYRLDEDPQWQKFIKRCANFKKQVQLTDFFHLAPPNQRSKARYHNIDVLVNWGAKKLQLYDGGGLTFAEQKKLKWLWDYQQDLVYWGQLVGAGMICRDLIRRNGIWSGCEQELSDRLIDMNLCPQGHEFACDLITFAEEEGNKVPEGKRVIGSTEIIESVFGTYKNTSEKGPKPMGRLILSMASRVGEPVSEKLIQTAFENVGRFEVDEWLAEAFR